MKQIELVFARERQPKPPTLCGKEIDKYIVNYKEWHIPDYYHFLYQKNNNNNYYVFCVWYKTWLIKICKNIDRETLSAWSQELRVLETIMLRNNV